MAARRHNGQMEIKRGLNGRTSKLCSLDSALYATTTTTMSHYKSVSVKDEHEMTRSPGPYGHSDPTDPAADPWNDELINMVCPPRGIGPFATLRRVGSTEINVFSLYSTVTISRSTTTTQQQAAKTVR